MIESFTRTYTYENGEIQRVQAVTFDSFKQLNFMFPKADERAFGRIVSLYRNFIVPKAPWVFGRMVLVYLPEDMSFKDKSAVGGPQLHEMLRRSVRVNSDGTLSYESERVREFCEDLRERGLLAVVCGKLPFTKILPVGGALGYLSENIPDARVKANANFFVMDCFDVASNADVIGTPIGLMAKDGKVINPPAFGREALLVDSEGKVAIRPFGLSELTFVINGAEYSKVLGNAKLYERPSTCHISRWQSGTFAVIVGCRVVAVYEHGGFDVPGSGFVLRTDSEVHVGDTVEYRGLEHIIFGIQVGNSVIVDGVKTAGFKSKFYNIYRKLGIHAYPPSLYPLDYERARAPRIALGASEDGRPCIIWAEGAKKTGYTPGDYSCGASLKEMADIAADLGLKNAVNLDGGGSAQIIVDGKRELEISERNPANGSEEERAVPVGIYVM